MAQAMTFQKELTLIPSSPVSKGVKEIIALVDDPRTSVSKLTTAICKNKGLMERMLRQANSPLYGFPRRISDPNFAVVVLGFDALKEMIVRSVVSGAFRRMVNSMVSYEPFWNHSIGCGLGARMIAEKTSLCDPNDAFVAGLLHDIGHLIINWSSEEAQNGASKESHGTQAFGPASLMLADYHAEVGSWLTERWGLSPVITEAIRHHHQPGNATSSDALTAVVHMSEVMCHALRIGTPDYEEAAGFDPIALQSLGLNEEDVNPEASQGYAASFVETMTRVPRFETIVQELKNGLLEAMEDLSERERLVLALLYYEGLSIPEIAKVLTATIEEIEQSQATALARLQAAVTLMS